MWQLNVFFGSSDDVSILFLYKGKWIRKICTVCAFLAMFVLVVSDPRLKFHRQWRPCWQAFQGREPKLFLFLSSCGKWMCSPVVRMRFLFCFCTKWNEFWRVVPFANFGYVLLLWFQIAGSDSNGDEDKDKKKPGSLETKSNPEDGKQISVSIIALSVFIYLSLQCFQFWSLFQMAIVCQL